jgi:hypothetical protein
VTWYGAGAGDQHVCRFKSLGKGGLFLCGSLIKPIGTSLKLIFEVPGGLVFAADAVVRSTASGEGMGVEFTKIGPQDQALLERLLETELAGGSGAGFSQEGHSDEKQGLRRSKDLKFGEK